MNNIYILFSFGVFLGVLIVLTFSLSQKISELIIDELIISRLFVLAILYIFFLCIEFVLFNYIKTNFLSSIMSEGVNRKYFSIAIYIGILSCLAFPNLERKIRATSARDIGWKQSIIDIARGEHNGVSVVLKNIPCLKKEDKNKYPYEKFGNDFIRILLDEKITNYKRDVLENSNQIIFFIHLNHYYPIEVEINSENNKSEKEFYFNVSEAIAKAFKIVNLKR